MSKVFKSELIRFLRGKKVYIFLAFVLALVFLQMQILKAFNMLANEGDVIYGSTNLTMSTIQSISNTILPIIIIIIATNIITEDYNSGIMKYKLLSPLNKEDFMIGKIVFICFCIISVFIITSLISFVLGGFILGIGEYERLQKVLSFRYFMFDISMCILVNSVSLIAFTCMVCLISLLIKSPRISLIVCNLLLFGSSILDSLSKTFKNISIITYLNLYGISNNLTDMSIVLKGLIISFIYILIFMILNISYIKNKDIIY